MNRGQTIAAVAVFVVLGAGGLRADLAKAKAERNLEKRARLALDNAADQLRRASGIYDAGDWDKTRAALDEMRESVDLAYASLKETGKAPRNSRHFKNLEIKTRALLKRFTDFRRKMAFEDREAVAPIEAHIQQVHDEVLESILAPPRREDRR